VHGSSFAGRTAAADVATSRARQSAEPLNVGVQKSSAVALRLGRRYFGAGRGASAPPLPQSSPTPASAPQGTTMGCDGTGVKRGATASFAFRRLVGGVRDLPQETPLASSTAPEAVDGGSLVPCDSLAHASLASAAAKEGLPGLSAANKTAASHGLSWTAADAVVPFNVKKEPEPAALVKLEDLAVDNGRRRAVAYALRTKLHPPDGPGKAAVLRAAERSTRFVAVATAAHHAGPGAADAGGSSTGDVVVGAAAQDAVGGEHETQDHGGGGTGPTGDARNATAAAPVAAAKVSGKGADDGQADGGGGGAQGGVGGVARGAGGAFWRAEHARAANVGAAGGLAGHSTGRGHGGHDDGHGGPRPGRRAYGIVGTDAAADDAAGLARDGDDGMHGGSYAARVAHDAMAAITMAGAAAASTTPIAGARTAAGTGGRSGMVSGGTGVAAGDADLGDGGTGATAAAPGRGCAAACDGGGEWTPAEPVAGVLRLHEARAAAAAAVAGGRHAVAVAGFRLFGPVQVAAAVAAFAGVGLSLERRVRLTRAVAVAADQNDLTGSVAVEAHEEDVLQSLLRHCHRTSCGRIPLGIRWRVMAFLRAQQ